MNETKYYCDLCKKENESKELYSLNLALKEQGKNIYRDHEYGDYHPSVYEKTLDICPECFKKLNVKYINRHDTKREKQKIIEKSNIRNILDLMSSLNLEFKIK